MSAHRLRVLELYMAATPSWREKAQRRGLLANDPAQRFAGTMFNSDAVHPKNADVMEAADNDVRARCGLPLAPLQY